VEEEEAEGEEKEGRGGGGGRGGGDSASVECLFSIAPPPGTPAAFSPRSHRIVV
jgi:hypothetical protein